MSNQVNVVIHKGFHRNKPFTGTYRLIKGFVQGARGGFITVHNPHPAVGAGPSSRVIVEPGDYELVDAVTGEAVADNVAVAAVAYAPGETTYAVAPAPMSYAAQVANNETEEEAMERICNTFGMLDKITDAAAQGIIRGLVVTGPPGVGKSFGVKKQLEVANEFRVLAEKEPKFEIVSGGISSIGLYQKLWHSRNPGFVLVFDDCDEVLEDSEMLTLMKAALNSGDTRRICWNKESRVLLNEDIPEAFDFEGSVLFLSNKNFDRELARNSRIAAHLAAIMSRCHVLDLEMSERDCLLRVKQVVRDGMLKSYSFTADEEASVVKYIMDNADDLLEVSLRMTKKIADFVKAFPGNWEKMAEATTLTKASKFKRIIAKQKAEAAIAAEVVVEVETAEAVTV